VGTNHEVETETKKGGLGESAGLKAATPNRMKATPSTDEPVFRGQRVCGQPALVLLKTDYLVIKGIRIQIRLP
jgi:hypothetical protein